MHPRWAWTAHRPPDGSGVPGFAARWALVTARPPSLIVGAGDRPCTAWRWVIDGEPDGPGAHVPVRAVGSRQVAEKVEAMRAFGGLQVAGPATALVFDLDVDIAGRKVPDAHSESTIWHMAGGMHDGVGGKLAGQQNGGTASSATAQLFRNSDRNMRTSPTWSRRPGKLRSPVRDAAIGTGGLIARSLVRALPLVIRLSTAASRGHRCGGGPAAPAYGLARWAARRLSRWHPLIAGM